MSRQNKIEQLDALKQKFQSELKDSEKENMNLQKRVSRLSNYLIRHLMIADE